MLWKKLSFNRNNFSETTSAIRSYLLQALNKKHNISYAAVTSYGLIYFRKEKILCSNLKMLVDLYGECLQEEPEYIPRKFKNDKTYVTLQEELNVGKSDFNNLQSESEILKLRKNNYLKILLIRIRY